jgi:hypothetical protein
MEKILIKRYHIKAIYDDVDVRYESARVETGTHIYHENFEYDGDNHGNYPRGFLSLGTDYDARREIIAVVKAENEDI